MKERITPERAEILALEALAWLAGRPDDIARFLSSSGLSEADLRRAAGDLELLSSLFDFLLANEPLLLNFCQETSVAPMAIQAARRALEG